MPEALLISSPSARMTRWGKPTSLVADMTKVTETVTAALRGEQLQPLLLGPADQ